MQSTDVPAKIPLPWADAGIKNTIPTASQIAITPGLASLTDGFPPVTFLDPSVGGVPPFGADFNGAFNMITAIQQWQSAGGLFKYDAAMSTAIGGYPKGAMLSNLAADGMWLNLADDNTTNPDATDGTPANWRAVATHGVGTVVLSNANVTLTPAQYGKQVIMLTGTLTANVQVTFPATLQGWTVVNNTTGAFTASALCAAGTPVACGQGATTSLRGNGTNVLNDAAGLGVGSTVPTAANTDSSTKIASTAHVKAATVGSPSAYVNVTASRAIGATYNNTTGRPIFITVSISTQALAGAGVRLFVAGAEVSQFYGQTSTSIFGNMCAIVPAGATYQVTNAVGTNTLSAWLEL